MSPTRTAPPARPAPAGGATHTGPPPAGGTTGRTSSTVWRRRLAIALQVVVLTAICLVWVYPFLWLLSASFKDEQAIYAGFLDLLPDVWHPENYARAWSTAGFSGYLLNSVLVTAATVVLVIVRCALAGYVLARYRFIGRKTVMAVFVATLFVPHGLTIIPVTELSDLLGLLDSRWGMILALTGGGHAAAVLLYTGYFRRIPRELEEAAVVDGAGFLRVFFRVMLPLSGPVTGTVAVVTFLAAWNNFLVPLVFTLSRPELRTLSVGMVAFTSENSVDFSGMAAGGTLALLPVVALFVLLQRHFVEGIAGAVKS